MLGVQKTIDLSKSTDKFDDLKCHIRDSIFHYTDECGFAGIKATSFINPSGSDCTRGPLTFASDYCGSKLGNVCLIDTNGTDDETLYDVLCCRLGLQKIERVYLLFMKSSIKQHLVKHDNNVCNGSLYLPGIEKGYHGKLSIDYIGKVYEIIFKRHAKEQ